VASYNVPEIVVRISHIFDHHLLVAPVDVLFSAVCSKLCRNCQMHAEPESRFTEQMKRLRYLIMFFL